MRAAGGAPTPPPPHPQPSIYEQVLDDLGFNPELPPLNTDACPSCDHAPHAAGLCEADTQPACNCNEDEAHD